MGVVRRRVSGATRKRVLGHGSGSGLVLENGRGMGNLPKRSGRWMGIRPGFATARGGAANSGEPSHAQQREEKEGKQARRVRYPHVKLWPAVGDDERRRRGGIGMAQTQLDGASPLESPCAAGPGSEKESSVRILVPRRSGGSASWWRRCCGTAGPRRRRGSSEQW